MRSSLLPEQNTHPSHPDESLKDVQERDGITSLIPRSEQEVISSEVGMRHR